MKQYLFTYGTLANGRAPASVRGLMGKLTPVGEGFIKGRLYDLGNFPGAKPSRIPRQTVRGTVFELPDDPAVLKGLDEYEEFSEERPSECLFIRKKVPARLRNGKELRCWTYLYNRHVSESRRIPSGDYSKATI